MKLNYPKEWFEKSALIEGDDEIGAGMPPVALPQVIVDMEDGVLT